MTDVIKEIGRTITSPNNTMRDAMAQHPTGSWYGFVIDSADDLIVWKSSDNLRTFSQVGIVAATYRNVSIWADWWTPGDSGSLIHIVVVTSAATVLYFNFNTSTDTLSSPVTVKTNTSYSSNQGSQITKSRGGKLFICWDVDGGPELGCHKSSDGGANWGVMATVFEGVTDATYLFPGNETDPDDIWCVFWDHSTNEISLKTYDDSLDSWSEQLISTSMAEATTERPQLAGVIDPSNNHLYIAAWNALASTGDLRCWDINGAGSIVGRTEIGTNELAGSMVRLSIRGNEIIVYYCGSDAAGESQADQNVYIRSSFDGMVTWGGEVPIFPQTLGDIDVLVASPIIYSYPRVTVIVQDFEKLGPGNWQSNYSFLVNSTPQLGRASTHLGVS